MSSNYCKKRARPTLTPSPPVSQPRTNGCTSRSSPDLKKSCLEVFPTVEYAYTTIPTYPSGQIGFMVCCKDAARDLKTPLRAWSEAEEERLCRYYNKTIHSASFVLPTFARKMLR